MRIKAHLYGNNHISMHPCCVFCNIHDIRYSKCVINNVLQCAFCTTMGVQKYMYCQSQPRRLMTFLFTPVVVFPLRFSYICLK